ncbi:ABC transporter ATP-binding protein [Desulfoluna spongiiphila]|uniref:Peptide/nickel transport system ATP-binding protein n=1 Tax=Desulfoluna spongiiphila TaxID=419481 RepID=A0A1G5F140_9BACT|nr:oligopeptide/dipeptide ABC transporter ATP-binding protein [Desulfoluna spongiiphila]SCY32922.1 peptide/nickel transport system ATP-binding protein [Desulfoluna spongiiphila]VVS94386.1 abc transporter-like [Desulfoluna spongiiphila]
MSTESTKRILTLNNVVKHFDISGGFLEKLSLKGGKLSLHSTVVQAVNGISLDILEGETLSVVGESGCGKSTLARCVIGIHTPDSGEVRFRGNRIDNLTPKAMMPYRAKMQMVFQDPYSSLNPRLTVQKTLEEPLRFHNPGIKNGEVKDRIAEVMEQVGVDPMWAQRYPHEFSGGQRQRVSIARALVVDPAFIVADEPISALDVSVQAQILNLLMETQEKRGLSYMFISHDLSVVRHISSRVAVMYLGSLCELADAETLYAEPRHPYTKALLSAIPKLNGEKSHISLKGEVPSPINLPTGCVFHGRCPHADTRCVQEIPEAKPCGTGLVACHRVEEGVL